MLTSDLVSLKEAAEQIGVSVRVLQKYCKGKKIDCVRLGRDWFIPKSTVAELVKNPPNRSGWPAGRPRR
jgi:excisionase family DNA binding protein